MPTGTNALIVYALFPMLFFVLFIVLFNYFSPSATERRWFATHGKRIMATVVKIDLRPAGSRGGVFYHYSVQARWEDKKTGKVHLVESGWVPRSYLKTYGNPSLSSDIAPGEPIEVLVDPNNPEHAMIASLPLKIYRRDTYYGEY